MQRKLVAFPRNDSPAPTDSAWTETLTMRFCFLVLTILLCFTLSHAKIKKTKKPPPKVAKKGAI